MKGFKRILVAVRDIEGFSRATLGKVAALAAGSACCDRGYDHQVGSDDDRMVELAPGGFDQRLPAMCSLSVSRAKSLAATLSAVKSSFGTS